MKTLINRILQSKFRFVYVNSQNQFELKADISRWATHVMNTGMFKPNYITMSWDQYDNVKKLL